MVGLRTQENTKFIAFFKLVQNTASEMDCVFFLDCGEGNQFENDIIECEDLSGWLIPNDKSEEFEKVFMTNREIPDKWDEFGTFVSWKKEGADISISFNE